MKTAKSKWIPFAGSDFLVVDDDTIILDYSSYTDPLVSDAPAKLTAADLTSGMQAIVITSDDTDKDGNTSIAHFIIVLNK